MFRGGAKTYLTTLKPKELLSRAFPLPREGGGLNEACETAKLQRPRHEVNLIPDEPNGPENLKVNLQKKQQPEAFKRSALNK